MHASLLGFSLESLVIDNDIIGATQRTIKGIEVNDERLSFETISRRLPQRTGSFSRQRPDAAADADRVPLSGVGDRKSPNEWVEKGRLTMLDRAIRRKNEVLANHFPSHVPSAVDDAIRAKFKVGLPRDAMRPRTNAAAE